MEFNILKEDVLDKKSLWDIFKLDSFDKLLELEVHHLGTILDEYKHAEPVKIAVIESKLINSLYISMGGKTDTPVVEVMAFMYVLLRTPNFRFQEFLANIKEAIFVDNMFQYFTDLDVVVPIQIYTNLLEQMPADQMRQIVNSRHNFTVDADSTDEDALKFSASLDPKEVESYLNHSGSVSSLFN